MTQVEQRGCGAPQLAAPHIERAETLLAEIAQLLEALARNGGDARLDLRALGLTVEDYAALRAALGEGAVDAHVTSTESTDVRETRFPGVWWVKHYGDSGAIEAEFLEICRVPEILASPEEDIARGLAELKARLAAH